MSHEEVTLQKKDSQHDEDKSVGYLNTFLPSIISNITIWECFCLATL